MSEEMLESRWRVLAENASAGSLDDLVFRTADGLAIHPLYPRRTEDGPHLWRSTGPWRVAQRVDHPDPEAANRLALLDLEGGTDALTLVTNGSPYSRGFGLAPDRSSLDLALRSIDLDFIEMRLDAGLDCRAAGAALGQIVEERRLTSANLQIDLGFDPIGVAARTGTAPDLSSLPHLLEIHRKAGLAGCPLLVDSRPYHESGAARAQELAVSLATGIGYLRALEAIGIDLDAARRLIAFLIVTDADSFVSLAMFRAIRRLWARVESSCGLTSIPLRLHAETAWRTMTRYDVWTNAMRATAGIFAAGLGGADVVTALPFTLVQGLPDEHARRLARNSQRVLIDESHLDAVDDPSAGAGAFETLTDELCELAWTSFQQIEREGGIIASLAAGNLQKWIAETDSERRAALSSLRTSLVGTNRFPSLDEPPPPVLDIPRRAERASTPKALPSRREAEPFEELRACVEGLTDRPTVLLVTLGSPASFGSAVSYAANFFAIAGLPSIVAAGCSIVETTAATLEQSAAKIVCVCAAKTHRDDAVALARTLKDKTAALVLAVGEQKPGDTGVDAFIHDGCDALATLAKVVEAASSSKP